MTSGRGEPRTRRAVHGRDLTVGQPGQKPDRRPEGHRQTPKGTQTAPQPDPQPQHDSQAPKDARRHTERRRTPQTSQRERRDDQQLRESNPRPTARSGGSHTNEKQGGSEGQQGHTNNGPATTQATGQPRAPASEGISSAKSIPDAGTAAAQDGAPPAARIPEPRKKNNTALGWANRKARPTLLKTLRRGNRETTGPEATDAPGGPI